MRWHKTNVVGTLNMLGLAKRIGARFLLTSTSEVYGDPLQHPQVETYWGNVNPIGNNSLYNIILFCEFLDATVSSNRLIGLTWEISRKNRNILNVGLISGHPTVTQ